MNESFSNYIEDFVRFIKKPVPYKIKLTFATKVKYLNISFIYLFIGAFISVFILHLFEYNGVIPYYKNSDETFILKYYDILTTHIIIILIAPLIEELAFRSYLKFSKINLAVSSAFGSYITLSFLSESSIYIIGNITYYKVIASLVIFFIVFNLLNNERVSLKVSSYWEKNYLLIFYSSVIVFGYLHLFNFGSLSLEKIIFSPIIILQFMVFGFVLGYVRIKLGLSWCIALHIMLNGFVSLLHL